MKQWPQGLWVVTPEGKVLSFHYHKNTPGLSFVQNQEKWRDDTLAMLQAALKSAGDLPPRAARQTHPFPDRGLGRTRDGGVRLAVSVISLRNGKQEGPPAIDSVLLAKDEWSAWLPPQGKTEWSLPEEVGRKFAPALSPLTDSIFVPRPANVTKGAITARVVREANGIQVIRYRGTWESRHDRDNDPRFPIRAEASGEGTGVYDAASGTLRSLIWVVKGTYRNGATAPAMPTAAVIEWKDE